MSPQAAATATLSLEADDAVATLRTLGRWIADLAGPCRLSETDRFRLDMVLTEAVTNIVDHAFPADQARRVELSVQCDAAAIRASVSDSGVPFNPVAAPAAEPHASLQDAAPGGLGLTLMRHYVDDWHYRRADGRNHLTVVLQRRA